MGTTAVTEVIVASGNAGKVREIGEILADQPYALSSLRDHWSPVPDIPETGATFEENARLKASWVYAQKQVWAMADDSGLEVDALNGEPGVLSARYAGDGATDAQNLQKLLDALHGVEEPQRTARFRCVVALMIGADETVIAEGRCEGYIVEQPRGDGGFGYDPVFVPEGFTHTFAELDQDTKNAISHRGKALRALRGKLVHRDT